VQKVLTCQNRLKAGFKEPESFGEKATTEDSVWAEFQAPVAGRLADVSKQEFSKTLI
jgi:hypothetical protein